MEAMDTSLNTGILLMSWTPSFFVTRTSVVECMERYGFHQPSAAPPAQSGARRHGMLIDPNSSPTIVSAVVHVHVLPPFSAVFLLQRRPTRWIRRASQFLAATAAALSQPVLLTLWRTSAVHRRPDAILISRQCDVVVG